MSAEELENYETDAQLALYQEYRDVMSLFTHAVDTDRRFYLANQVDVTPRVSEGTIYFEVFMSDVWVWDVFRTNRFVKTVRAFSTHDVNIEERLPNQEFTMPALKGLTEELQGIIDTDNPARSIDGSADITQAQGSPRRADSDGSAE